MQHLIKISFFALAVLVSSTALVPSAHADDYMPETFTAAQFAEYERQLNAILKTTRDEEKVFVAKIVLLVRLGEIPSRLVSTSYQWGLKNRPDTNYPFIYFEKVLRIQAKAISLDEKIPAFDFKIYRSAGQRAAGQNKSVGQRTEANRNFFSRRPTIR
ncbi:MAG: hypothetical protein ACI87E_004032 [Mariniblastus sp.]|jgi:hypothetical protein